MLRVPMTFIVFVFNMYDAELELTVNCHFFLKLIHRIL